MNRLRTERSTLDATDARILDLLAKDARTRVSDLARAVNLSPPSVSDRIRRLEGIGVIRGYTIDIDPAACGFPISAWLRIRPVPGQLQTVAAILDRIDQIVECDRVTGEDCFVARAHVASIAELESLIDLVIPFAMTNTSIIQSTPVPRRLPPLEAAP